MSNSSPDGNASLSPNITISPDKADMYIISMGKYFPADRIPALKDQLLQLNERQFSLIMAQDLKNPTSMLIISLFLGFLGVDRFMLNQIGMGILKLLTGGLFGILALIDWITIQKKTRVFNYSAVQRLIGQFAEGKNPV
jgi:TM2 domain-containing membrane protein YozV